MLPKNVTDKHNKEVQNDFLFEKLVQREDKKAIENIL